jgi:hypothetical protein
MLLNIAAVTCAKVIPQRLLVMSGTLLGNHLSHDFQKVVGISVMAAISDSVIHGVWLLVNHEGTLLAIILTLTLIDR